MERRITKINHRQRTQLADRRRFLKLSGKMGLMAATMGFSGVTIGSGSSISRSQAAEVDVLADRPHHHTADGFRNPPGSPTHEHNLSNWVKHIWRELAGDDPELPENHFLGEGRAATGRCGARGARLAVAGQPTDPRLVGALVTSLREVLERFPHMAPPQ